MMHQQIFAQAALLAGQLDEQQMDLLRVLCMTADTSLRSRLKEGISPEDCKADYIAAASLYALAVLNEAKQAGGVEEFKAGDLTVKRSNADAASRCLHKQAELIIMPFLKDRFSFRGV